MARVFVEEVSLQTRRMLRTSSMPGACSVDALKTVSSQLKTQFNVEIIVAAINGISGDANGTAYQALSTVASVRIVSMNKCTFHGL